MTNINEGLPPNDLRLFLRTISMATPEQVISLGKESADHIDALEASNKALVEALIKVLPHVNTAREARQHAANERQDTPALDAVMVAHAVLTAAKDTT